MGDKLGSAAKFGVTTAAHGLRGMEGMMGQGQSSGGGGGGPTGGGDPGMQLLQGLLGSKAKPGPVQMPAQQQPRIATPVGPANVSQQPSPAAQYLQQLQQTMGSLRGY